MPTAIATVFVQAAAPASSDGANASFLGEHILSVSISVVGILLLAATVLVFALTRAAKRNERGLLKAHRAVRDLPGPATYESLEIVGSHLTFDTMLEAQWQEFREGVVAVARGDSASMFNTLAFGDFVKDDAYLYTIQAGKFRFPVLHRIPGFCTGVGILGTFTGITFALMQLSGVLEQGGGAGGALVKEMPQLVQSLSSAFITSIMGVLVSLGVTLIVSNRESHVLAELDSLREAIDRHIVRVTPQSLLEEQYRLLEQIHQEARESRSNLQTIADDLAEKIGESMNDVLLPQLQAITEAVRNQVQNAESSSTQQARRFTDEMVSQLTGSLSTSFASMGDTVNASTQRLTDVGEQLATVVTQAQDTAQQQRALMDASTEAVRSAQDGARQAASEIHDMQSLGTQLTKLSENIGLQVNRTVQLQEEQGRERLDAEKHSKRAAESMASSSARQEQAAGKALEAAERLAQTMGQLQATVQSLTSSTSSAAAQVERSSTALVQRTAHEQKLVADLKTAAATMSSTMASSTPALQAFERVAEKMGDQEQQLHLLSARMSDLVDTVGGAGKELAEKLSSVQTSMHESATSMNTMLSGLQAWNDEANSAIKQFGVGVRQVIEESLQEYDKSLAGAVSQLQGSLEDFGEIAEELAETSRRIKQ